MEKTRWSFCERVCRQRAKASKQEQLEAAVREYAAEASLKEEDLLVLTAVHAAAVTSNMSAGRLKRQQDVLMGDSWVLAEGVDRKRLPQMGVQYRVPQAASTGRVSAPLTPMFFVLAIEAIIAKPPSESGAYGHTSPPVKSFDHQ